MYALTLTADELDFVKAAVAAVKHETEHPTIVATLAAAKRKPVRKAPEPVEVFAPNTGDAALDAFMVAHHDPKWKAPKITDGEPWSIYKRRGGDRRALAVVLAEAEATAKANGWPGSYNVLGTKVEA